jgi:hypothetical protein
MHSRVLRRSSHQNKVWLLARPAVSRQLCCHHCSISNRSSWKLLLRMPLVQRQAAAAAVLAQPLAAPSNQGRAVAVRAPRSYSSSLVQLVNRQQHPRQALLLLLLLHQLLAAVMLTEQDQAAAAAGSSQTQVVVGLHPSQPALLQMRRRKRPAAVAAA